MEVTPSVSDSSDMTAVMAGAMVRGCCFELLERKMEALPFFRPELASAALMARRVRILRNILFVKDQKGLASGKLGVWERSNRRDARKQQNEKYAVMSFLCKK